MIKLRFTTLDGVRKTKNFKTLTGARKAAHDWVGKDAQIGRNYAVSTDGVVKVVATGCTLVELFSSTIIGTPDSGEFFKIKVGGQYLTQVFATRAAAIDYLEENQLHDVTYDDVDGSIGVMSCDVERWVSVAGKGELAPLPQLPRQAFITDDEIPF
jgi:hypothetical protein